MGLASAVAGASAAPPMSGTREHRCKVGSPPAWYLWRIPPGVKKLSPITTTIACGRRFLGLPYEIVAVNTSKGLWVYADSGPLGFSEGLSFALGFLSVPSTSSVVGALHPRGPVSPVSSAQTWLGVEAIFHHRGQRRRVMRRPTTAFVTGDLLTKLNQS